MKKLALVILGFLLYFGANAQFERVVPENGYSRFLRTLKGDYAIVYNSADAVVFDENGQTIMNLDYYEPVGGYWNAFELIDTSVVFSGGGFWLDQFGWFGMPFHRHFNSYWEDIENLSSLWDDIYNAEKRVNGGFISYAQSYEGLYCRTENGDIIWDNFQLNLKILDVATNMNLQTIAATSQGMLVIDSIGINDTLFANYDFIQVETISFGNLVGAKSDTIYLFDSNFEVIKKAPIPGQVVKDMKSMEDKVAVLTESNHVYLYDQDLLPISDFQLDYGHLTFKNIVPDQDGIVLAGDHHYGVYPAGNAAIFIKKFEADGFDPFEKRDIGLAFIQPATQTDVWPENGKFKAKFHNVKFQLFNYADTVLNSFRVNVRFPDLPMEWPLQPNPIPQHFFKQFNNLNLAPGQNTTLTWDEFTATFVGYPSGSNLELCFWSSMPDGKSDINPNNDVACADFFVDTKEKTGQDFSFEIYPNPTSNDCVVSWGEFMGGEVKVAVIDLLGKIVQTQQVQNGSHSVTLSGLVKGMYSVSIEFDGVIIGTEKLVKI